MAKAKTKARVKVKKVDVSVSEDCPYIPLADSDISEIEKLAARGLNKTQIAHCLGLGNSKFWKLIKYQSQVSQAIKAGRAEGINKVADALFENATTNNNFQAQQFFLKVRDPKRWNETQQIKADISGNLNVSFNMDFIGSKP